MAKEVKLPQFGKSMLEGAIVASNYKVGDHVSKGDVLFDIETDKATLEMESPSGGFVKNILVVIDVTVPVGTVLMLLGEEDEQVDQGYIDSITFRAEPKASEPQFEDGHDFMHELSVVGGKDLQEALREIREGEIPAESSIKAGQEIPVSKLQKIIASRMLRSKREIPCFYLNALVDLTEIVSLRGELNQAAKVKITYNDFIIRAMALSLRHWPVMSGQLGKNCIHIPDRIGVSIAVAVDGGVIAPAVMDPDKLSIEQIAVESHELIDRVKNGQHHLDDLEGGCITISNLGNFGVDMFIPVAVPGQCSILGVGKIQDKCVPAGKEIEIRKMMSMTLSVDHKVANGADAAQFLDNIKKMLESPKSLV